MVKGDQGIVNLRKTQIVDLGGNFDPKPIQLILVSVMGAHLWHFFLKALIVLNGDV
jgi:fatty acid/phospholipid biosynthesis enzyme